MDGSPVRRCVAVASHGRRCQQSPFRGSPYCWHHLQSRKLPAPSRPVERGGRVVPIDDPGAEVTVSVDRTAMATRLANLLDAPTLNALVAFMDSRRDGDFMLQRDSGIVTSSTQNRPKRRAAGP